MMVEKTQNKAKQIAERCISVRARMLNRLVTSIFDEALRSHGIRVSQLNILVAVSAYGPVTSRQLCRVLQMDASTFSRSISRMRKRNWLTSEPSGKGKILTIRVTPRGLAKVEQVYSHWEEAQAKAVDVLGDSTANAITAAGNHLLMEGMMK